MTLSIERQQPVENQHNSHSFLADYKAGYTPITYEMQIAVELGVPLVCKLPETTAELTLPRQGVLIVNESYGSPELPFADTQLDTLQQAIESVAIACPVPEVIIPPNTPVSIEPVGYTPLQAKRSARKEREVQKKEKRQAESNVTKREKTIRRVKNIDIFHGWHNNQYFENGINRSKLDRSLRLQET